MNDQAFAGNRRPFQTAAFSRLPRLTLVGFVTAAVTLAGCKAKQIDDATLTANVKAAFASDSAINKQPIQTSVTNGVVTLSGNVSDETAREVAAQDAAEVKGVRVVSNTLQIAGIPVAPTVTMPTETAVAPVPTATPAAKPVHSVTRPTTVEERKIIATHQPLPPPPVAAPAPAPPPQPTYRDVTVSAGTVIPIRITQTLETGHVEEGAPFSGVVTHEIVADGMAVIPAGSAVSGRVVQAKDAGHFKGNSILSIELTSIRRRGTSIAVSTSPYTVEGKGRGKNSAEKIGGGAAVGAILGGILGGGKGAAIGGLAGGGGGAAYQGLTHGQEVAITSETQIRFRLTNSFSVRTSESASNYEPTNYQPELQTRP